MNYILSGIVNERERVPFRWGEGDILDELLKEGYEIVEKYETQLETIEDIEDDDLLFADCIIYVLRKDSKLYELITCLDNDF